MRLGRRQRLFLYVGIPVPIIVLVYSFAFGPHLDSLKSLQQVLPVKRGELQSVRGIAEEQKATEAEIAELKQRIEQRGKGFDLGGFVSSTASSLKLRERCQVELVPQLPKAGLVYAPSSVKVSLEGVTLKELTDLLHGIDAADKVLSVENIEISLPGFGKQGLQVEMTISTLIQR